MAIDLQISGSVYDARQKYGWANGSHTDSWVSFSSASDSVNNWVGGLIFAGVDLPQGAKISVAYFTGWFNSTITDNPRCDIYAENVDSAAVFNCVTNCARHRAGNITSASVPWVQLDVGVGWRDSPDISIVIQEIVDRPGWTPGNNINIVPIGRTDLLWNCDITSWNGNPAQAAKLHIESGDPFGPKIQVI